MEEVLGVVVCICLRNLLSEYRCHVTTSTERKHGGLLFLHFQKYIWISVKADTDKLAILAHISRKKNLCI